ncbi:MauE/DoxX family redox-associated membrane protein [Serinicoccus kebangsaanensis]|uniref:MauE/DoxX family redox-associated membrane protein n=1 Tax=Serinicoccus kebangsaanensis TaxID=2602069 RepID=UPI00124F5493|nr:MauE/DoxX family redox-associated membrane protein [Serinicoccus kebangsaanensis]
MSLLGSAAGLAVGLVLLAAGSAHLRRPQETVRALRAHTLLPSALARPVALGLGPVEVALGVGLLAAGAGALGAGPARLLALGAALLCSAFTGYLWAVQRRVAGTGAEVPCGCGLGTTPVTHWAVLRAGVLTLLALVVLVAAPAGWQAEPGAPVWAQVCVAGCAGLALAVATAALPAARAVPAGLTTVGQVAR